MPVPGFESFMLPLLRALEDGADHPVSEVRERIAHEMALTEKDRAELLPSGKQAIFDNRLGWAKTYVEKAGLMATVKRGVYRITDDGRRLLAQKPDAVNKQVLLKFDKFRTFVQQRQDDQSSMADDAVAATDPSVTPEETLEKSYQAIRKKVEADLLDAVRQASPQFFEKLVVELLVKMGYGGTLEDAGRALAVGRSHDGGIDGIIKEDHLGLDAIYVQAKRWQATVGRPEVQAFAGSLEGERARKGIFLTTSTFSKEARDYVKRIERKIVLVDGPQLAGYMFDFGIGVNPVSSFEIKRVDGDYFSEE
jgi:restriction system protein